MPKIDGVVIGGGESKGSAEAESKGVKGEGKPETVRFWSPISNYMVAVTPGKNVGFSNHAVILRADDPNVEKLRGVRGGDVREVVDRPFGDTESEARFNAFLRTLVYTGERGEPSKRGVIALMGLFRQDEYTDLDASTPLVADQLIVKAIKSKSFRGGI